MECPARRRRERRRSAGLARLSLVRASARSSAGREASRLTASSAVTRASWAPSAVLATSAALPWPAAAGLRGPRRASSEWASAGERSSSALRNTVSHQPLGFQLPRGLRKCGCGLGERCGRVRAAHSDATIGGGDFIGLSSSSRQAARSQRLSFRARMMWLLDVGLLAASVVIPEPRSQRPSADSDRIRAVGHGDAGLGEFLPLCSRELALLGAEGWVGRVDGLIDWRRDGVGFFYRAAASGRAAKARFSTTPFLITSKVASRTQGRSTSEISCGSAV